MIAGKLDALAALRGAEGYMAGWEHQADGSCLFYENHCPICAAVVACQGFCKIGAGSLSSCARGLAG